MVHPRWFGGRRRIGGRDWCGIRTLKGRSTQPRLTGRALSRPLRRTRSAFGYDAKRRADSPNPSGYSPGPFSGSVADSLSGSGVEHVRGPRGTLVNTTLLSRVASNDPHAVQECIDRFGGLVWSLARRLLGSQAEAEDAVQEIFTEIWRNAWKYDESVASETAFVAMIARRRLIDRRRKLDRRHDRGAMPEGVADDSVAAPGASVSEEAAKAAEALSLLSSEQRRCLRLSVYEGLSHELIATSTGMPLGTVKTHVRRGLMKIRELLGVQQETTTPHAPLHSSTPVRTPGEVSA